MVVARNTRRVSRESIHRLLGETHIRHKNNQPADKNTKHSKTQHSHQGKGKLRGKQGNLRRLQAENTNRRKYRTLSYHGRRSSERCELQECSGRNDCTLPLSQVSDPESG